MDDHANPCRTYAYEGEAGLIIASYPAGKQQPIVAAPYAEEVWTGIEYASASHMIMRGLVREGLEIVAAVRERYDGARRNPYNDIECGSYYARSMSAWQLVNAWSGLSADLVAGTISFAPKTDGDFRLPWSAGSAWGVLENRAGQIRLHVLGGELPPMDIFVDARKYRVPRLSGGTAQDLQPA